MVLTASAQKFHVALLITTGFGLSFFPSSFTFFSAKGFSQQRENHKLVQRYSPGLRPICVFTDSTIKKSN